MSGDYLKWDLNRLREEYRVLDETHGHTIGDLNEAQRERDRFKAGLEIIMEAGPIHGGVWCKAQARGHLLDLDYDHYPETGRPETEPS
jgi:hypothetical protein